MSKLNSEFNYRYQVIGETPWAKIQTLQGFLCGRKRAVVLEKVGELKYQAKLAELKHLQEIGGLPHIVLNLQAEIMELESSLEEAHKCYRDNEEEIEILERYLAELYEIVEPTRIKGYSDEQMFEVNAANEFTMVVAKEIQSEILCHGHPSPAKLHNAMNNPYTFKALQAVGLIPEGAKMIFGNANPLEIEIRESQVCLPK